MDFLKNIFGNGASKFVETVGKVFDDLTTSTEEKTILDNEMRKAEMQYKLEEHKLDVEETKAVLADKQNARSIYEKTKDTSDRIAFRIMNWNLPVLAAMVIVNIVCIKFFDSTLLAIISNVLGQVIQMLINERLTVINFFFGSSQGSKEKSEIINRQKS